jgi:hypothetical protein
MMFFLSLALTVAWLMQERLGGDTLLAPDGERYAELLPEALLSRLPEVGCNCTCCLNTSAVAPRPVAT